MTLEAVINGIGGHEFVRFGNHGARDVGWGVGTAIVRFNLRDGHAVDPVRVVNWRTEPDRRRGLEKPCGHRIGEVGGDVVFKVLRLHHVATGAAENAPHPEQRSEEEGLILENGAAKSSAEIVADGFWQDFPKLATRGESIVKMHL